MEQRGTISRAELLIKSLDFSFYDKSILQRVAV